jgi:putative spermidine/putrescine transport system permease protein
VTAATDIRHATMQSLPRSGRDSFWLLISPILFAYLAFFAAPMLLLVAASVSPETGPAGFQNWRRFLTDTYYLNAAWQTIKLGLLVVASTTLLAFPLMLVYRVASPLGRRLILFAAILPFLTSVVVRTFAWIAILSRDGVINQSLMALGAIAEPLRLLPSELGLVLALTQIELPFMLLPLLSVASRIDPGVIDASRSLGSSEFRTMIRVIVPLTLPGLIAGWLLVFASSVTAFVSQSIIGGARLSYLPHLIYQNALVNFDWSFAAVIALVLLVCVITIVTILKRLVVRAERRVYG